MIPILKYVMNSGTRIICPGTMMPARMYSSTPPRPFQTMISRAYPAATPMNTIMITDGIVTMMLFM